MVKSNKKTVFIAVLSIIALAIISTVGFVHAKYIYQKYYGQNTVTAEDFYFNIDLIEDYSEGKEINIYGGGVTLPFTVQNFFDDERVNDKNIKYTISVATSVAGVTLKKGSADITDETLTGGTKNSVAYNLYIPEGYKEGDEVTVTVRSTKPYKKTMTLTFKLHTYRYKVEYYVVDSVDSPYAELIILANEKIERELICVDWTAINASDNVFEVDTTSPYVLDYNETTKKTEMDLTTNDPGVGYLSKITVTRPMDILESISIYFFKDDESKNYSVGRTGVDLGDDNKYTIRLQNP